jgi:hypothetical protein
MIRKVKQEAEDCGATLLMGGDWNAVPDVKRDRNNRVDGRARRQEEYQGDKLIGPAMRGLRDATRESGGTYEDGKGTWSRIDSWWASEGLKVSYDPVPGSVGAGFTRHRGVGVVLEGKVGREEAQQPLPELRTLGAVPAEGDPLWSVFYDRVDARMGRALQRGEVNGDEVLAAWNLSAREVFGEKKQTHRARGILGDKVPRFMPMATWGQARQDGNRMWKALRALRKERGMEEREPELTEGGRPLSAEKTLESIERRWQELYKHPRGGVGWDEDEWRGTLEKIRRIVAGGRSLMGQVGPPTWVEFQAYVKSLPEGKAGWGVLRYEMLKRAGEGQLRTWYGEDNSTGSEWRMGSR